MIHTELFMSFTPVLVVPELGDCWIWCGKMNRNGYGRLINGKMAHREMYEVVTGGPIPEGHLLDHLCRVRGCINPYHTEPVTHSVNTLRGEAKLFGRDLHPRHYAKRRNTWATTEERYFK